MAHSINLSPVSYKRWQDLIFNRRMPGGAIQWDDAWRSEWELEFHISDPTRLVSHVTRTCRNFKELTNTYSPRQIDKGLWSLLGNRIEFGKTLADPSVEVERRVECVRSMLHPYAKYVAPSRKHWMENCFEMWWDLLSGDFWSAHRLRIKAEELESASWDYQDNEENGDEKAQRRDEFYAAPFDLELSWVEQLAKFGLTPEDLETEYSKITISYSEIEPQEQLVADAMLDTLTQILYLEDGRCEYYALHGLNHLQHPRGAEVVQAFINERKRGWDKDSLAYAEACRDGEAM